MNRVFSADTQNFRRRRLVCAMAADIGQISDGRDVARDDRKLSILAAFLSELHHWLKLLESKLQSLFSSCRCSESTKHSPVCAVFVTFDDFKKQ